MIPLTIILIIACFTGAGFLLLYLVKRFINGIIHNEEDEEQTVLLNHSDREIEDRLNNRPTEPKD